MKKLLYFLASMAIVTQPLASSIACKQKNQNSNNDDGVEYDPKNPDFSIDKSLTDTQNQMKIGAEMISRIIVASRHENLNFNMNEILSCYLTPQSTALNMPSSYTYKGRKVDLADPINKFKGLLQPNIGKLDGAHFTGVYGSYLMGMYEDSFYQNFINDQGFTDGFNKEGGVGFNKPGKTDNSMGILMGMNKNLNLSEDENRRSLAWGVQDTGALSNYLLNDGFDGGYPGGTNGTSSPFTPANPTGEDGGTNGAGYLYYNSILASGKSKVNSFDEFKSKTVNDKLKTHKFSVADIINGDYASSIDGTPFNATGGLLSISAGALNLKGYINKFSALKNSVEESDLGAESLLTYANFMTPLLTKDGNTNELRIQGAALSLIYNVQAVINLIQRDNQYSNLRDFLSKNGFNSEILNDKINIRKEVEIAKLLEPTKEYVNSKKFYEADDVDVNKDQLVNLNKVSKFLKELNRFQKQLSSDNLKQQLANDFFIDKNSPFNKCYQLIISPKIEGTIDLGGLEQKGWQKLVEKDASGAIKILNIVANAYEGLAKKDTKNIIESMENNKSINDLSRSEKQKLITLLGYDYSEKKYKEGTFFYDYYNLSNNTDVEGVNELNNLFAYLNSSVDDSMTNVHEQATQYLINKEYWKTSDVNVGVTSPTEVNGKIEFTLDYSGNGDSDSNADTQTAKIEVPQKFNPYQTIVDNQKDLAESTALKDKIDTSKVSGVVLGKEQLNMSEEDIMKYDGLGVNYKKVDHKYKIVWQNISNDVENPYWVIVDFKSYNGDKQFYNIY
ncbi:hypothetical protein SHELI_v1c11480 [Spiroplasma helicoides]|uniref:Lipoprotein n=1 Tax=Spiroplasma helicoides TaxID=216938 RepID=A0A1B3SMD7_9MOLU|nr:hypothetical protein [Spiroplasma helicoides]AOG61095.1 hypothetical protein SHELI_v1c11480 [Spiroplasma helicoides]